MRNQNILVISPEPWDHIFVSKHHYAKTLAERGNRVFFLGPPEHQMALSLRRTQYEKLFVVSYGGFLKGLRFLPKRIRKYIFLRMFIGIQNLCGVRFDVVWSFDNSVFYDFDALPQSVFCISHIVDLNQNFNTLTASKTANLCIGVKKEIVDRLKKYNSQTVLIPHGVQPFPVVLNRMALPGRNKIKAIYIGNLDMPFMDWDLLCSLVQTFQNVDFILIGSSQDERKLDFLNKVYPNTNVDFVDKVDAEQIPHYLGSADVLMTIYTDDYALNYATPHKMMEYLASGKVIVSNWIVEYEELDKNGLILMSRSHPDFLLNFKKVVDSLSYWNSVQKMNGRRARTSHSTYEIQIEKIENIINKIYGS